MLECAGVSLVIDETTILDGIDWSVRDRERWLLEELARGAREHVDRSSKEPEDE